MQTGDKFKVDYQLARVILMSAQIPLSGGLGGIDGEIYIWEHFIRRFRSSEIELKTVYTDFIVRPEAVCDWWRKEYMTADQKHFRGDAYQEAV